MATLIKTTEQSTAEIRTWPCDFTKDLAEAVTIVGAEVVHIPPSGDPSPCEAVPTSPYVLATLGPLTVTGNHFLAVFALLSNGDKSEIRLQIPVKF